MASNSSAASTHRLPTISGSAALQELGESRTGSSPHIRTRVEALDDLVGGGFEKGKVSELWGPSGAGKTAIGLGAAAEVLQHGSNVTWIAAAAPLSSIRLEDVAGASSLSSFRYVFAQTLTHLLATILDQCNQCLPPDTQLLVIDGFNNLVDSDYPRQSSFASSGKSEPQKWQAGRRSAILGYTVSALNRLAVLNNVAVVVINGCATTSRSGLGLGAALVSGVGGAEWEAGIWTRLAIFRDFNGRFATIQKLRGSNRNGNGITSRAIIFSVSEGGVAKGHESMITLSSASVREVIISPSRPRKRTFEEIADSESDEGDECVWAELDAEEIPLQSADVEEIGGSE